MQIANSYLTVDLAALGAEIRSIRTPDGAEWLWHGDPAWWGGRSPLLFPTIGRNPDNAVTIGGQKFPMAAHGFARTTEFAVAESAAEHARFVLEASAATREHFPFDFRLSMSYRLDGTTLTATAEVENLDTKPMPFQFGYHPGFAWPLPHSAGKPHSFTLANGAEPALYRLNADKMLVRAELPSPFAAGKLIPDRAHFEDDAMIFPHGAGDAMRFAAEGGDSIEIVITNLPNLALWQKPGAPFLCIEPWQGTAPFADEADVLENRNGVLSLVPGATRAFTMAMRFITG